MQSSVMNMSSGQEMATYFCDGSINEHFGGSWVGHLGAIGSFRNWYDSIRTSPDGKPHHRSASYVPMLWFPKHLPLEPLCKALLPPLAMSAELYFAHRRTYRYLLCPDGTQRQGQLDGHHINNWSHAALYPGFIISGIIDLISRRGLLPPGTSQVFLSLSFLEDAMLLLLHKKHAPLDIVVHSLLANSMLGTSIFTLLEVGFPNSLLVTAGRILTIALQGTWLIAAARMLFEGRPAYLEDGNDLAPAMFAPVLFAAHAVLISISLLTMFLLFGAAHKWLAQRANHKHLHKLSSDGRPPLKVSTSESQEWHGLLQGGDEALWKSGGVKRQLELPLSHLV